jgi:hypothetical protein
MIPAANGPMPVTAKAQRHPQYECAQAVIRSEIEVPMVNVPI